MTRNHIVRDNLEDEKEQQAARIAELIEERLSLRVSVDCLFWLVHRFMNAFGQPVGSLVAWLVN